MKNGYYSIKKRLLAVILSLMMIFQMVPTGVLAEGGQVVTSDPVTPDKESEAPVKKSVAPAKNAATPEEVSPDTQEEGNTGTTEEAAEAETWTVTFYNRDAEVHASLKVKKGEAIGKLPATIAREDYTAYWAIGEIVQGGQGKEISVTGDRIGADYVPTADTVIVPDYDKISYTVTFYTTDEKTEVLTTRTVDVDTNYCLNDIPEVPAEAGYTGKWVYSGGDFTNMVEVKADTEVWPVYEQIVFTVTYEVEGKEYQKDTYYTGDRLTLPKDPVVEGKDFKGWYDEKTETKYEDSEQINSDLTLTARFTGQHSVRFIVKNGEAETVTLSQYFRGSGETIGALPDDPFISGMIFEKWVNQETGEEVTETTEVTKSFTALAVFREVEIYTVEAIYYYEVENQPDKEFNVDLIQIEEKDLPYTIVPPDSTQTEVGAGGTTYYPETPTIQVEKDNFDSNKKYTLRIKYVPYTAEYDFVYKLKDLTGEGYTEITDSREHKLGVLGSYVNPTVKNFDYAVFEKAEGAEITKKDGQELVVKYTRKKFQVSYDTMGGSYVAGDTVTYGDQYTVTNTKPTREGYTFGGWYKDEDLSQRADSEITVEKDTILYAKWNPEKVDYTIVYMVEKYDNSTNTTSFVYDNSRTATEFVGTTVYASSAPTLPESNYNGYEKDTQFNAKSSVKIAADGSSVLIVHYKLIRYTLVFNANNGEISIDGQTYNGSNYQIKDIVLGQEMGSLWPASSSEIYRNNRYFDGWTGGPSTYITKQYELVWNHVKNANNNHVMTYTASWANSSYNRNAQYWLQQTDGTYKVESSYTQIGLNTDNLGAKEIDGYTKHTGTPNGYPGSGKNQTIKVPVPAYTDTYKDDGDHWYDTPSSYYRTITRNGHTYTFDHAEAYYTYWGELRYYYYYVCNEPAGEKEIKGYVYNFYYDRAKYNIDYYHGSNNLKTVKEIFFEADISGSTYNYVPEKPDNTDSVDYSDYTWGGWYDDSALQNPYTFSTMPGHNLKVYAKWVPPTYTVTFKADGGAPEPETLTVNKYDKVEKPNPNPTKSGYTFDGWFTSASGNTLYDWNTQITSNTTIYAQWTKNALSYTVHYELLDKDDNPIGPAANDKVVTNPNFEVGQSVKDSPECLQTA